MGEFRRFLWALPFSRLNLQFFIYSQPSILSSELLPFELSLTLTNSLSLSESLSLPSSPSPLPSSVTDTFTPLNDTLPFQFSSFSLSTSDKSDDSPLEDSLESVHLKLQWFFRSEEPSLDSLSVGLLSLPSEFSFLFHPMKPSLTSVPFPVTLSTSPRTLPTGKSSRRPTSVSTSP